MAAPLLHDEGALGVLSVLDRPEQTLFSLQEMELLGLFAQPGGDRGRPAAQGTQGEALLAKAGATLAVVARLATAVDALEDEQREAGLQAPRRPRATRSGPERRRGPACARASRILRDASGYSLSVPGSGPPRVGPSAVGPSASGPWASTSGSSSAASAVGALGGRDLSAVGTLGVVGRGPRPRPRCVISSDIPCSSLSGAHRAVLSNKTAHGRRNLPSSAFHSARPGEMLRA